MARTAGQKTKAANGPTTDPPAESIDQVRDLLFGGQMRMVDARLQGLEQRMQNENAAVRAELDRQVATLDDSIRKELARHAERLASERTKRGEDLKALGADLKEALKGLERRHQSLEETAGLADAELRDHLLKQSAAFSGELARTAERLSGELDRIATELQSEKLDSAALVAGLTDLAGKLVGGGRPATSSASSSSAPASGKRASRA